MLAAAMTRLLTLAAMVPQTGVETSGSVPAAPQPIATRQTLFAVPFRIDPARQSSQEPVKVQLWVSGDRGNHWQMYSTTEPSREHFLFRAGADGEYWFVVRTLDRSGQWRPKSADTPGLQVVVDTTLPKLQLQAEQGQAGQVTARWQVDEPNLKPQTLAIQYRTTDDGPWQSVAIDPQNLQTNGSTGTGEVTWWPRDVSQGVQVRAEVSDMAGNLAVSHARLRQQQAAGTEPPSTAGQSNPPWHAGTTTAGPTTQWPADRVTGTPISYGRDAGQESGTEYSGTDYSGTDYSGTDYSGTGYGDKGYGDTSHADTASDPPTGSVTGRVNPPIGNRFTPPSQNEFTPPGRSQFTPPSQTGTGPTNSGFTSGQRPKMVNSRLFELEYDVASVGPSGIARVELWGTRNNGQTWKSFSLDDDNRSPLLVTVDEEGTYGFRVMVTSGAGLGRRSPRSGELPEVVIGVDWTKPTARITSVEKGTGSESGHLIIAWKADDKMLAARPVSLSFSQNAAGPWTTIATGLENTGRYAWPIDRRVPERIYVRLEVRDEAGNVAEFETASSGLEDRFRPAGRIRNVRPIGQAPRTSPARY